MSPEMFFFPAVRRRCSVLRLPVSLRQLRALTLHLLSLFEPALPPPPADGPPRVARSVFATCWSAEQQPANIQTYKERLKYLQLLDAEYIAASLPVCGDFSAAPLLYLLGTLHVPFRLLWKPCQELAAAHCHQLAAERLAELWGHLSAEAAAAVRGTMAPGVGTEETAGEMAETETEEMETSQDGASETEQETETGAESEPEREELDELEQRLAALDDRLDFANFRLLLWQMSSDLCPLLEPVCGGQLIDQLFSFLDREFFSSDMSFAKEQDLLDRRRPDQGQMVTRRPKGEGVEDDAAEEGQEEDEEEEEEEERPKKKRAGEKKKGIVQALCAHLTVMSKMTSLRRSEKSQQLFETFLHFLTHKRSDVQKVALECVYAYKAKGLNPYRETLFSLMEDNNFKTTLTSFSIDTESGILKSEHRPHVLPVLTRILYGRMRTSTGKGAASRDNAAVRRRVIVGFLAGCLPEEVDQFLDLTLAALAARVKPDPVEMVREVMSSVDVCHALPLRQLQSALLLLTAVFFKLGSRLLPSVPRLLRLLLGAAAHVSALLAEQHRLPGWHVRTLKKIRGMILACLSDMFERFDTFPWSAAETEAVFIASVWPSLPKLTQESTTAPTGLLKLFVVWASTPRYYPLLVKEMAEAPRLSPLWCMLSLLTVRACHSSVTTAVVRAAEQLLIVRPPPPPLSVTEDGEPEPPPPLAVTGLPEWSTGDGAVSGPAAVAANVAPLLEYLSGRLQAGGAARLSAAELTVLSAVCRLEAGPARQHAGSLASLLLPVLASARPPSETRQRQLLITLRHLLSAAERPAQFVRPLAGLLSHLPSRESHLAVVSCLRTVGERDAAVELLAGTVDALCAMDAKQVDEPDFDRRLVEYGRVNERLRQAEILEEDYLRLVVHCCLWSLEHEADLALRDSSTFCLQEAARAVGRLLAVHRSAAVAFLSSCLLPALRRRLRSKDDQLRHDTVAVLQVVVLAGAEHMPKLAELAQLSNTADSEHDFFENIRHIQVHRRTRALKRVVEGLTDGSLRMRADVVTNYVLPLANVYLFNDKYVKYTGLTDTAVRLIGLVSGRMSWHQYQAFLRHFLALLPTCTRQRDAVKVLVAVLDAFPFDLSSVAPDVTMSIISATRADEHGWRTRRQAAAEAGDGDGEVNGPPTEQPALGGAGWLGWGGRHHHRRRAGRGGDGAGAGDGRRAAGAGRCRGPRGGGGAGDGAGAGGSVRQTG